MNAGKNFTTGGTENTEKGRTCAEVNSLNEAKSKAGYCHNQFFNF